MRRFHNKKNRNIFMYLIAGLGNPGKKYERTRHNIGFETLDIFIDECGIGPASQKFQALIGKGTLNGEKVLAVKPLTYMNLSGDSLRKIVNYFDIDPKNNLVVISDDVDLPPGKIRIRKQGSAGGHNGLKSIIENLGTEEFIRIRVGVGAKPEGGDLANHVLGHISKQERTLIDDAEKRAAEAALMIIREGIDKAMNTYNQKRH